MKPITRRILLGSAAVVAALAPLPLLGLTPPDFFAQSPKKDVISFAQVKADVTKLVGNQFAASENDFGIKYTAADMTRIQTRVLDAVQYVLSENYKFKEEHTGIEQLERMPIAKEKLHDDILGHGKLVPARGPIR